MKFYGGNYFRINKRYNSLFGVNNDFEIKVLLFICLKANFFAIMKIF